MKGEIAVRYTIRHFDLPLLTFEANMDSADTGLHFIKVYEENRSFLPLNLTVSEDGVERWLRHRAIPKNRAYVDALLSKVGLSLNRPLGIIAANKGLSLNDCFWVDAEIDHDNLTSEQKTHYDQLNKSCTDTISAKMRQLEYKDNIDYNKKAVNAYNSAFTSFKNNESRYKDKSQLLGLVSTTLFAYDAGRLFNETLIFYNHVYSYIFNKLDDNGKLELTKYSIECERKQG